jgi:two-component system phosphate regulon response regulator PhoB
MKTILVVDDEKDIVDLLRYHLEQAGFLVASAPDGSSGLQKARQGPPSLVILDLMLPGMDGKDLCRALKADPQTMSIPVLMLTARTDEIDRIIGFELGAEDYVTKPFSPRELVLRVKAIIRRHNHEPGLPATIRVRDLVIDSARHEVALGQKLLRLSATEFKLLAELIRKPGRVHTREQLLERVWGHNHDGYARTVDSHIQKLREKMGSCGDWIETIRGVGYRFREETM